MKNLLFMVLIVLFTFTKCQMKSNNNDNSNSNINNRIERDINEKKTSKMYLRRLRPFLNSFFHKGPFFKYRFKRPRRPYPKPSSPKPPSSYYSMNLPFKQYSVNSVKSVQHYGTGNQQPNFLAPPPEVMKAPEPVNQLHEFHGSGSSKPSFEFTKNKKPNLTSQTQGFGKPKFQSIIGVQHPEKDGMKNIIKSNENVKDAERLRIKSKTPIFKPYSAKSIKKPRKLSLQSSTYFQVKPLSIDSLKISTNVSFIPSQSLIEKDRRVQSRPKANNIWHKEEFQPIQNSSILSFSQNDVLFEKPEMHLASSFQQEFLPLQSSSILNSHENSDKQVVSSIQQNFHPIKSSSILNSRAKQEKKIVSSFIHNSDNLNKDLNKQIQHDNQMKHAPISENAVQIESPTSSLDKPKTNIQNFSLTPEKNISKILLSGSIPVNKNIDVPKINAGILPLKNELPQAHYHNFPPYLRTTK